MSCLINRLKSQMFFTCKNFMFSDFTWKKKFWSRKWWGLAPHPLPCDSLISLSFTLYLISYFNRVFTIWNCQSSIANAYKPFFVNSLFHNSSNKIMLIRVNLSISNHEAIASCSNYLLQAFENRGYIKQRIVRKNELYFIIKEVWKAIMTRHARNFWRRSLMNLNRLTTNKEIVVLQW